MLCTELFLGRGIQHEDRGSSCSLTYWYSYGRFWSKVLWIESGCFKSFLLSAGIVLLRILILEQGYFLCVPVRSMDWVTSRLINSLLY